MSGNTRLIDKLGYTLVEVLLVLALLAIILSIAAPSFQLISSYNEKIELMEFKKDIIFTRNKAVMENSVYTIIINIEENKYIIFNNSKRVSVKERKFSKGIVLKSDNMEHSIVFYPTGSPKKAGSIQLTNKANEDIIITIIPATGKVSLKTR